MSRLVAVLLFAAVLVVLAHVKGPDPSSLCCPGPAHRMTPDQGEIEYCPVRGR
jgi:hypothetical protein